MFEFRISGISLDVEATTRVPLTLTNPALDPENIERTFSYPIRLPATPRNKAVLKHADRLDTATDQEKYSCQLFISGFLFDKGQLVVSSVGDRGIQCRFENVGRGLLDELDAISIRDLVGTIEIPQIYTGLYQILILDTRPLVSVDYTVTINGVDYTFTADGTDAPSDIAIALQGMINVHYPGLATVGPSTLILTNNTGEQLNVQINVNMTFSTYLSDPQAWADNFQAFQQDVVTNGDDRIVFPVHYNSGLYGDNNPAFKNHINHYRNNVAQKNSPTETTGSWTDTVIPFVRLTYLVGLILDAVGLTEIVSDFYDLSDTQQLYIDNLTTLDEISSYPDQSGLTKYLNHYRQTIDLAEHLPDMTARDFLVYTFGGFNQYMTIEGSKLLIKNRSTPIRPLPIDWTIKSSASYEYTKTQRVGVLLSYSRDPKDSYSDPAQLQDYQLGDGGIEEMVQFFTQHMANVSYYGAYTWRIPSANQLGNCQPLDLSDNDPTYRLLFYRGLAPDSGAGQYPFGTYETVDYFGTVVGTLSLAWDGSDGLFAQLWDGYTDILDKKPITRTIRLDPQDLINAKSWENAKRKIFHEKGEITAVISSIQFRVRRAYMEAATVELISVI